MSDQIPISILLDIKEDIGKLTGQMQDVKIELLSAAKHRQELADSSSAARETLQPLVKTVANLEIDVSGLKKFESRVGAYIWLGGSIASGVLFLLWEGLRYGVDRLWPHH